MTGGGFKGVAKGSVFSFSRKTYLANLKEQQRNLEPQYAAKQQRDIMTQYNVAKTTPD